MSQDETLRMAAEVVDKFSRPLAQMSKSLRSLSDQVKNTHTAGKEHAEGHAEALGELGKRVRETSEHVKRGLEPAFEGLGIKMIGAAGAIALVTESIREFAGSARDLTFLHRQTGMAVNQLRVLQEMAPKIGSSASAMSDSLKSFGEHMERLQRNPMAEVNDTWVKLRNTAKGTNYDVVNLYKSLEKIPDRQKQLEAVIKFAEKIRDPSQKRQFAAALGLDPAIFNKTLKEFRQDYEETHKRIGDLTDDEIAKGKKTQEAWDNLGSSFRKIKEEVGVGLTGSFERLTKAVDAWMESHKELAHDVEHGAESVEHVFDVISTQIDRFNSGKAIEWKKIFGLTELDTIDQRLEYMGALWKARFAKLRASTGLGTQEDADKAELERQDVLKRQSPEAFKIDEEQRREQQERDSNSNVTRSKWRLLFGPSRNGMGTPGQEEGRPENPYKPFGLPDFKKGEQAKPLSQSAPPEAATWLKDIDKSTIALKAAEWAVWGAAKVPAIAARVPHLESAMAWGPSMAGSAALWAGGQLYQETHSHPAMPSGSIMRQQRGGKSVRELLGDKQSSLAGQRYASLGGSMNDASAPLPVSQWTADPKRDIRESTEEGTRQGVVDGLTDYFRTINGGAGAGGGGAGGAGFGRAGAGATGGGTGGASAGGGGGGGGGSGLTGGPGPQSSEPGHSGETTGGASAPMQREHLRKLFGQSAASEPGQSSPWGGTGGVPHYLGSQSAFLQRYGLPGGGAASAQLLQNYSDPTKYPSTQKGADWTHSASFPSGSGGGEAGQSPTGRTFQREHLRKLFGQSAATEPGQGHGQVAPLFPPWNRADEFGAGGGAAIGGVGMEELQNVSSRFSNFQEGRKITPPRGHGAGGGSSNVTDSGGPGPIPANVLAEARKVAGSGPGGVRSFLAAHGYSTSSAWCGKFAASVIRDQGGKPPPNPEIASQWRLYGHETQNPVPGDMAVRRDNHGRYVPTGQTGSHVTVFGGVDNGGKTFAATGGNQGHHEANTSHYDLKRFQFYHKDPGGDRGAEAGHARKWPADSSHLRKKFGQTQTYGFGNILGDDEDNHEVQNGVTVFDSEKFKNFPLSKNVEDRRLEGARTGYSPGLITNLFKNFKERLLSKDSDNDKMSIDAGINDIGKAKPFSSPQSNLLGNAKKAGVLGGDVNHKISGDASVSVDFKNMPRGVQTSARGEGMFKEVKLNRGRAMPLASQEA